MDCSFASLGAGIWTECDGENWDVDCSSVTSPSQQAIRLSFLEYMNLNLNLTYRAILIMCVFCYLNYGNQKKHLKLYNANTASIKTL